jgi:nitrogen fixation protein FixH
MNWGRSILLCFLLFMSFIGYLSYKMMKVNVDLVRPNYYQTEIEFQSQIEKQKNAAKFPVEFKQELETVKIKFPKNTKTGTLEFYRASNKMEDKKVSFGETLNYEYATSELAKGKWKVLINWSDGERDYYSEHDLII